VRRETFVAAGGFDAGRFRRAAVEDIELGMRLDDAGESIMLDPQVRGTHLKRWSLASMVRTDLHRRGVPWVRLQLEAGRVSGSLNLAWRYRLSAVAAVLAAVAALARRPLAGLSAVAALIALNASFYALLRRRGGIGLAVVGVPLLVLHHLTAVVAAIVGAAAHVHGRGRPARHR
jgi:hypothetical protein